MFIKHKDAVDTSKTIKTSRPDYSPNTIQAITKAQNNIKK